MHELPNLSSGAKMMQTGLSIPRKLPYAAVCGVVWCDLLMEDSQRDVSNLPATPSLQEADHVLCSLRQLLSLPLLLLLFLAGLLLQGHLL